MGRKNRKFNKKNAITFQLVHRSQRDPLQSDPDSSLFVLKPLSNNINNNDNDYDNDYDNNDHNDNFDEENDKFADPEHEDEYQQQPSQRTSRQSFLTDDFPDDGYDYSQHLKVIRPGGIFIPSAVFGSKNERPVGLLNIQSSENELDPDLLEALEGGGDKEDLDDNFVELAGGEISENQSSNSRFADFQAEEDTEDNDDNEDDLEDERHINGSDSRTRKFKREERKPNRLVDERFEHVALAYSDSEIGELNEDDESIRGKLTIDAFADVLDDFIASSQDTIQPSQFISPATQQMNATTEQNLNEPDLQSSESEQDIVEEQVSDEEKWDCESIISTYTNTENHPVLIEEPKSVKKIFISRKTQMPILAQQEQPKQISKAQDSNQKHATKKLPLRHKDETTEEKRHRKALIKQERKANRGKKKELKMMYKKEEMRQQHILVVNNQHAIAI